MPHAKVSFGRPVREPALREKSATTLPVDKSSNLHVDKAANLH